MAEGGRARAWIAAWPQGLAAARRRVLQAPLAAPLATRSAGALRQWASAEFAPGRLVPWLPVAFGLGIAIYFTADREPALWAGAVLLTLLSLGAVLARNRALAFPLLLGAAMLAAGFSVATLRTIWVAHPILRYPAWNVVVRGWVEVREERARSDRIVIRVAEIDSPRVREKLQRVRVAVRKGTAPPVGAFVQLKARLTPPLAPLRPGGYDFARDLYFQGLGASGFVLGKIATLAPPAGPSAWLLYHALIGDMRDAVDARIRAALSGDEGSIASALITGKRDAITDRVNDAMYVSSLAHVLSISGYHMAVVAGVVFFLIRALLALVPAFVSRAPIKKYAALAAIAAAAFYLLLSGAEVATQRSFIMIAIVLAGVLLDRPVLTLRTITVAALIVLLVAPESLVNPSFQMSFAATLALIAGYQGSLGWTPSADSSIGARAALWGAREITGLILASMVAGLATTPYAAYHFHRMAPYGVVANLLAMPVVSVLVMPAGLAAIVAMPFGFDAPLWRLMGQGIDWMIAVALWVADLPGAIGHIAAFGTGPLLLGTAGLIVICLLRSPLRWTGVGLALIAAAWAIATPQPAVLVAANGNSIAVRGADGRLSIASSRRDRFTVRDWLAADADGRAANDPSLTASVRCDPIGCIVPLGNGRRLAALSLSLEAMAEDCRRAAVIASPQEAPPGCAALVIDRKMWRRSGAVALYPSGDGFTVEQTRPPGYDRPWAPAYRVRSTSAAAAKARARAGAAAPDATPPSEALQADD